MDAGIDNKEQKKGLVIFAGRIALILFIGLSLYLLVSSVILVFLTKPDKEIAVPHVVGRRFEDVYNSLVRKGLVPELKPYEVYDMDDGIILNQYPESGRIVFEGEKVKLVISRSKVFLPVPNLAGLKLPFAINKLKNIHYNDRSYAIGTGVISYIPSDKITESVVIQQSPEAGEEISPDRRVNLLVSSGKAGGEMKMPGLHGQSIDIAFDLLLSKGLFVQEEIATADTASKSGIIESHIPGTGDAILTGMIVKLKVNYYPKKEKAYTSYERVSYTIPSGEKEGIFEAYIDDGGPKRIRFSRKMKAGGKIDFIFLRKGAARISIVNNRQIVETINIEPDEFN